MQDYSIKQFNIENSTKLKRDYPTREEGGEGSYRAVVVGAVGVGAPYIGLHGCSVKSDGSSERPKLSLTFRGPSPTV